jgi:ketosteroid isomerase-like protein
MKLSGTVFARACAPMRPLLLWSLPDGRLNLEYFLLEAISMFRCLSYLMSVLSLLLLLPARAPAQQPTAAAVATEIREATRRYDEALRRADVAAVEQFWAPEYTFVNPRGERVTRAARLANLRATRTSFDSLAHTPEDEHIQTYGNDDVAVYTTLITIGGRYSGKAVRGRYRALVVWVRRDGRWQQVASQLTRILGR